jgi:hypothetical protein
MARKSTFTYTESKYAPDLVKIMRAGEGPYTRSMLATALGEIYPTMYWQALINEVSGAILMDKLSKAGRFRVVKKGWYDIDRGQELSA